MRIVSTMPPSWHANLTSGVAWNTMSGDLAHRGQNLRGEHGVWVLPHHETDTIKRFYPGESLLNAVRHHAHRTAQ